MLSENWFQGSVEDAISQATSLQIPFLVFLCEGELETTKKCFDIVDEIVSKRKFVAVRLQKGSRDYEFFLQVCPVTTLPMLCIIHQGAIQISMTAENSNEWKGKVEKLFVNAPPAAAHPEKAKSKKDAHESNPSSAPTTKPTASASLSEYARKLKDDREHKARILLQIEQDRLDLQARQRRQAAAVGPNSSPAKPDTGEVSLSRSRSTEMGKPFAALAIRQTDGAMLRKVFPGDETLGVVRRFIDEKRTDGSVPYTLVATFPYRVLDAMENSSLLELGFCPSATMILKPVAGTTDAVSAPSGIVGILTALIAYILQLLTSLMTKFRGKQKEEPMEEAEEQGPKSPSSSSKTTMRIRTMNEVRSKKSDGDSNEDRRETYNGNSTSQE